MWERWQALKAAAFEAHDKTKGPGGAAMCICGQNGGGHAACCMLREFESLVSYLPTKGLPRAWKDKIELMRSVIG